MRDGHRPSQAHPGHNTPISNTIHVFPHTHISIQSIVDSTSNSELIEGQSPSLHSLATSSYLAYNVSWDPSSDGRVRRKALALFNRNKGLLYCSRHLTLAIIELALNATECEDEPIAQNVLVTLMMHAASNSAPDLELQFGAFLENASHKSRLNALTLHVLNSRSVPFFCDFFYALSLLGHSAPAECQASVVPALRCAIMTARNDSVIKQAASCYLKLVGTEKCTAEVAESLLSAARSTESTAVAVALVHCHSDRAQRSKPQPEKSSIKHAPRFPVDVVAYSAALPSFFCRLPSAALRALSLQIIDQQAHSSDAPFVLNCLLSLPHFLLKGFVFNTWTLLLRKMQCPAALRPQIGGSCNIIEISFGDAGGTASVADFSHRTGIAAMLLPLRWHCESACPTSIFELASNYSDFSDEGLFMLQNVLTHLADGSNAVLESPTIARVLVNLCISNHHAIEELIEVIKSCQSVWLHVLQHLKLSQNTGVEFHPSERRLAEVLLSCILRTESASIKRGILSPETCSLFVSWSELLGSHDLIVSLWLEASLSECFIRSCDRSTCVSTLRSFFSSASHADSLRSMAKKFQLVTSNASESACCSRFTNCCIESLLHTMASTIDAPSQGGLSPCITDSAATFLNVLISHHVPFFEDSSHALIALEFILLGVQSSESSLGSLSGQALTNLFRHRVVDMLRPRIESLLSVCVSQLFGLFRQCEYTSAARIVSAALGSTGSYLSNLTSSILLREVCVRSGNEVPVNWNQLSCRDTLSTIRLLLGAQSFTSCGSLCTLRFLEPWDDASLALAMDCVSVTLVNSHQQLSQNQLSISDSSGDDEPEQDFVGKLHLFELRKKFRAISEGLSLLSECLKRCPCDSVQISQDWLRRIFADIMGLCCNVDHVGATEAAAALLLQIFELRVVHLQATSRMLLLQTLARFSATLSLEDSQLCEYLKAVDKGVAVPERSDSYGWRRCSHVCLPIVASLKALISSHLLRLRDGTDVFDAFIDAVIVQAKLNPASKSGIDCLNLLYFITNDHAMICRVHSRRSAVLSVCLAAFSANSFNCQSATCLVICNLTTKMYGVLFARKREYELRVSSLTTCDWAVFTSLSPDSAPGALIALFTLFSMIRGSDDELLSLEPVERSRSLVLACCRSPIAKLRFSASRALPRLVAPSATTALIRDLSFAIQDAKRKQHWNHLHGLTLAAAALQESLR